MRLADLDVKCKNIIYTVEGCKNKSGFVGVIAIARLWLPLKRELASEARLRERKGCGFMRFYFSPSDFLLTQKATSLVRGRQGRLLQLRPYKPRFAFYSSFV